MALTGSFPCARSYTFSASSPTPMSMSLARSHRQAHQVRQGHATDQVRCQPRGQVFLVLDANFLIQTNKGFELAEGGLRGNPREMSLVDSRPPSASVVVVEDAFVLALDKTVIQEKLDTDTGFASRFYRSIAIFLSQRMRSTVGEVTATRPTNLPRTKTNLMLQRTGQRPPRGPRDSVASAAEIDGMSGALRRASSFGKRAPFRMRC